MNPATTVILIWGHDLLSPWPEALCTNAAIAIYYLALEAARQGRPLDHDQRADTYHIGKNSYILCPMPLLQVDHVDQLRRRHEHPHR